VVLRFDRAGLTRSAGTPVLRDFSLTLAPGEVVALVGRSGAGKSTALKLVNRLLDPTEGAVFVEGQDTRAWDPIRLRRRVGYVFQDVGLFPHLTVAANVGVVPGLEGWAADRTNKRTDELLDLVGLKPATYRTRFPRELSGGERQRVGVARALAVDPPILLMDEPFGALDPITRADLRREFQRLQALLHTTVLIVTHDLFEAFALGDRVAILHDGRLVACDTPAVIAKAQDPPVRALLDAWPVSPDRESLR
jgi:osmoprotectant transport system ATP-binding protein